MGLSGLQANIFIPNELPRRIRESSKHRAEVLVYDALKSQLNLSQRDWVIVHSARWMTKMHAGSAPKTGEADFLLTHPKHGVICVEVKGGKISYSDGQWYSTNRYGERFEIDPFNQVERNAYELARKFDKMKRWSGGSDRDKYAQWVIFPDSTSPANAIYPPEYDSQMVTDQLAMDKLVEGLLEASSFWYGEDGWQHPAAPHARGLLLDLFEKERKFTMPMAADVAGEQQELERLTDSQYSVISAIAGNPRVAVAGGAGSGKTWLARKRAAQLASEGFRVLLTCQSRKLAEHLQSITQTGPNFIVSAYDELLELLSDQNAADDLTKSEYAWRLAALIEKSPELSFDAVFVDEAQDFSAEQWPFVEWLLGSEKQGVLYVFYDDNQQLSDSATVLPENMMSLQLDDNVRTTRAIHKDMVAYYQGQKEQRPRGPSGRSVEKINSEGKLQHCVRRVIADLLKSERFDASDLVVLTPADTASSALAETGLADARKLTDKPKLGTDVLLSSIRDFKGLECSVVIVCEYDQLPTEEAERRRILYTAYSRPKFHLVLIDESKENPSSES